MREKKPDSKKALSLLSEAEREMKYTRTVKATEDSAFSIIRNIYECFRMLGDAYLINEGIESADHIESINSLLTIKADTKRPMQSIENLRRLRHNVNYYGYHPTAAEANDAIDIADKCFGELLKVIKSKTK